eukprot:364611-Chlamydomonas_euryale.AAC.3
MAWASKLAVFWDVQLCNPKVPRGRLQRHHFREFPEFPGRTKLILGQRFEQRRRNVRWTGRPVRSY